MATKDKTDLEYQKLAVQLGRELLRIPEPTPAEILAVAEKVANCPACCAELIGMIVTCQHVSMLRRMVIWQAKHGPALKD